MPQAAPAQHRPSILVIRPTPGERHCHTETRDCWELLAGKCGYTVEAIGPRRDILVARTAAGALAGEWCHGRSGVLHHPRGQAW